MPKARVPRRLAAILAADVVGYSGLMGMDESGTLDRLKAHRNELIEPKIAVHGGRMIKLMGDGALVEFISVVDALACAVDIQQGMQERNQGEPAEQRIEFRIGINLGDVIVEGDDIYGDGVNVAARLEGLADPGGICVSEVVHTAAGNKLPLAYQDIGEQRVKNIASPVRAYKILLSGEEAGLVKRRAGPKSWSWPAVVVIIALIAMVGWQLWRPASEPAAITGTELSLGKPSLAVLPFQNISESPDQEYFADGMTDDLITDLSKVSGLFVVARNSSFAYKGQSADVRQVANDLGVKYVLEGSVRRAGDKVRINAQLIDASTGGHIWAERYDRQMTAIFELQDEVIERIVTALAVRLTPQESESVTHRSTKNAAAYDYFLRGQALVRTTDYREAREAYEQAVAIDPGFARALGALSLSYSIAAQDGWSTDPQEDMQRALALAEQAHAMDDKIPQVHFALSFAYLINGDHRQAIDAARRALELDPGYTDAIGLLAWIHAFAGDPQEALRLLEQLKRSSPNLNASTLVVLGLAHFIAGDLERSIKAFLAARESNPEEMTNRIYLTAALSRSGQQDEAEWETTEILMLNPDLSVNQWITTQPYKDSNELSRLRDDLRRAGLPE